MKNIMTKEFIAFWKAFAETIITMIIGTFCFILFIPSLGHSLRLFNRWLSYDDEELER